MAHSVSKRGVAIRSRGSLFGFFGAALTAWRQRNHLSQLDAHMLRDIGVTEAESQREIGRPLWDVPSNWRL